MPTPGFTILENRAIISLSGEDTRSFLQGVISNDATKVGAERAIFAAFLTPQGKYLFDFFVVEMGDALLLDCEAARAGDFMRRLSMYKLRAKVDISDPSEDFTVAAVFGDGAHECLGLENVAGHAGVLDGGAVYVDPRLPEAGARAILPADRARQILTDKRCREAGFAEYDEFRIGLGLPDGSRDMIVDKTLLLEAGFDELNGVDWDKGCFLGQELTARTKYRGLVKRRLVPVKLEGPLPDAGTPIMCDGREVGEMRSGVAGNGMALMRIEAVEGGAECQAGETRIVPVKPEWADF